MGLSKDDNTSSDKNLLNLHLSLIQLKILNIPTKKPQSYFGLI